MSGSGPSVVGVLARGCFALALLIVVCTVVVPVLVSGLQEARGDYHRARLRASIEDSQRRILADELSQVLPPVAASMSDAELEELVEQVCAQLTAGRGQARVRGLLAPLAPRVDSSRLDRWTRLARHSCVR